MKKIKMFAILLSVLMILSINFNQVFAENFAENEENYTESNIVEETTYGDFIDHFISELDKRGYDTSCVVFFETDNWNEDTICNRTKTNALFVEVFYGLRVDKYGNGQIINTEDTDYNYIHYDCVPIETVIVTFSLYNPNTNYGDDIIERYDYWNNGMEYRG